MMNQVNQYNPSTVSHPGTTLKETIKELGMTQIELAERMGRPKKTVNEVIKGKTSITSETALQLESVLGVPATFWIQRQYNYDEALARKNQGQEFIQYVSWAEKFPLKVMNKCFAFPLHKDDTEQVKQLLSFFGVASPNQWERTWSNIAVQFRRANHFKFNKEALTAWLRVGEVKASNIECKEYNKSKFKEALKTIRTFTLNDDPNECIKKMQELCAECGVAYIPIPELPRTGVSGATRWLTASKALIQQSLRYKSNDQFWFTFFHEAGHIVLHENEEMFLEFDGNKNKKEDEANEFAGNLLIPESEYQEFTSLTNSFTRTSVKSFADQIKIDAGIVVGRLQHDKIIRFHQFNDLKQKYEWAFKENIN